MNPAALVTGAAKRIGQAVALSLAKDGFDIVLHYHTSDLQARKTAKLIAQKKRKVSLLKANLSNDEEVNQLMAQAKKLFPRLSLLINCASIFERSQLLTSNSVFLERQLNINFKAPYILSGTFVKLVKRGSIINFLDTHISDNKTSYSDYLLSKKLLSEYTRIAAVEFAPLIRVNAIAPGLILPPDGKKDNYLNRLAQNIPLKKKGDIKDITQAVRFLVNSEFITGQTIFVDGGENLL